MNSTFAALYTRFSPFPWSVRLRVTRWLSGAIYALSGVIGAAAFLYPFFLRAQGQVYNSGSTLVLTTGLLMLCLLVLLLEIQGQVISAKLVAALGLLVAVTAILRFVDNAVPIPGGFSPIFAPIIMAGYVFGPRFGFLMGVMTLLVSALITGGVGPWLPYQMFTTGWVGLTAGWLPQTTRPRVALFLLALFGLGWGFLFGVIINLYAWPFWIGEATLSWQPGSTLATMVHHYLTYYTLTSLWWDVMAALGNVALILLLGQPVLKALRRFRDRFQFEQEGERFVTGNPHP
ncbi:MAG: ECF transporter S component [Chloroflexi bacterium]|nr:ECF transporter S component [Chloroflexota bacterium]MBP8055316.1 ECF transporter S component [Chloroflexota bacterium]